MKKNIRISTLLNCILVVIFLAYSYSWMVTEPSYGEIVDYNRDLIIASSGVDVDMYIYSGSDYVLYEEENIVVNNMAPNDAIRFKFVIKNAKYVATITDIVFANIYGDIEDLKPYLTVECTSPTTFVKDFEKDILTTSTFEGLEVTNYMKFYNDFKVEINEEGLIYWTIKLDKKADNRIVNKSLTIDNIIFLNG